jgi:CBS domain-containing protein
MFSKVLARRSRPVQTKMEQPRNSKAAGQRGADLALEAAVGECKLTSALKLSKGAGSMTAKNPYHLRVRDVLSKDVVTIDANDTLQTALELMTESRLTALPVIDNQKRCAGVLSASDIVEITRNINEEMWDLGRGDEASYEWLRDNLAEHDMARRSVEEFMTDNVATVTPEQTLHEAAREMLRHRVHRLPVVDKNGKLLGIISTMDVLAAFVEGAPE